MDISSSEPSYTLYPGAINSVILQKDRLLNSWNNFYEINMHIISISQSKHTSYILTSVPFLKLLSDLTDHLTARNPKISRKKIAVTNSMHIYLLGRYEGAIKTPGLSPLPWNGRRHEDRLLKTGKLNSDSWPGKKEKTLATDWSTTKQCGAIRYRIKYLVTSQ